WVNRRWMEWAVFLWLSTRVEEWVSRAEEMRGTSAERDRLVHALEEARADEAKIQRGLRSLQSLVASGDLSDEDYRARRREAEEKLKVIAERIEDAQARLDALNPDGDGYERLHSLLGAEMPAGTGPGEPPPGRGVDGGEAPAAAEDHPARAGVDRPGRGAAAARRVQGDQPTRAAAREARPEAEPPRSP